MKKKSIVLLVLMVSMGIFTFTDLEISQALYNPQSQFGYVFKVFGELPYFIAGLFSTSFLLVSVDQGSRKLGRFSQRIVLFLLLTQVSKHFIVNLNHYAELDMAILTMTIAITLVSVMSITFSFWIKEKVDVKKLKKWALCGLILCLTNYIAINVLKTFVGRMRFREMSDFTEYTRWFVINAKALSDGYKSFPSAHTAGAATIFWFLYLPKVFKMNKTLLLHIIVWSWIILTMMSRVILGAHFITDTTMSVIIMYSAYLLADKLVYSKDQENLMRKSA